MQNNEVPGAPACRYDLSKSVRAADNWQGIPGMDPYVPTPK